MVLSYKSDLVLKINILLIVLIALSYQVTGDKMSAFTLYACSFEVFGRVQGNFKRSQATYCCHCTNCKFLISCQLFRCLLSQGKCAII